MFFGPEWATLSDPALPAALAKKADSCLVYFQIRRKAPVGTALLVLPCVQCNHAISVFKQLIFGLPSFSD